MVLRKSIVHILAILSLFFSSKVRAQKLYLKLTKINTNRVRKIYPNDNITVHTKLEKYKGKLQILNEEYISINKHKIKIEDIIKIEKNKVDFKAPKSKI